jgi:hypothetical protein
MVRLGKGDLYVINHALFYALRTEGKEYELTEISAKYITGCHAKLKKMSDSLNRVL